MAWFAIDAPPAKLQADQLVTVDPQLTEMATGIVPVAPFDRLLTEA